MTFLLQLMVYYVKESFLSFFQSSAFSFQMPQA